MTSLYRLNRKKQQLHRIGAATYSDLNLKERADIQEWVKADPSILFPETGDELLLITSEFDGFDKTRERLDVLAMDKAGRLVVIELKRDTSTTTAHMQVVGYAAYVSAFGFSDVVDVYAQFQRGLGRTSTDAEYEAEIRDFIETEQTDAEWVPNPRLVVAAGSFRAEVLASCHWLRGHDIDISCVKISPYRLGDDVLVHISTLVPLPEEDTILMRRRRDGSRRGRKTGGAHVQRNEEWWRKSNPRASAAFFEVLERFGQWAQDAGHSLDINWTATSYVGFWAGSRCVAPFWPQKRGAAVYLPDHSTDGSEDAPSDFFIDLKADLKEADVSLSWAFKYNGGANPLRVALTPKAFDNEAVAGLLAATVGASGDGT